jgi:NAD(P)-dependent dehydrogenase (short-subunit alcohol dehydrogenase family)
MNTFLNGKLALVTGGSRGIGRAVAHHLLEAGAAAAICGRDAGRLEKTVRELQDETGGKIVGTPADISSEEEVAALFRFVDERLGGLDILINNAGIGVFGSVERLSAEEWRRTIGTNLNGVFFCCREAMARFRNRGGGSVINISSLAGKNPFAGGAAYNASKFGLNGFSEAMMMDHRYDNVRVSYVMPGSVDTGFSPRLDRSGWKIAPEDVADVVLGILRMPERTLVSRVEMRPSKPSK